jgi:hypothetical protein
MKYARIIFPIVLALIVGACARPPQADIDAARKAVADAGKNSDIAAYAPETLKSAQDKLAQMESELAAKHYDKVKSLALDAKAVAASAASEAVRGREKAKADATALIAALTQAIPETAKKLAAAAKARAVKLDFAGLTKQLTAARAAVAEADKDAADGNFAVALQKATVVQAQLSDAERAIADAVQAAGKKK